MTRGRARRGFLLIEALLTLGVIGLAMVALNSALILIIKSNVNSEASSVSVNLSHRMLEEIRLRKWDEKTATPPARIGQGSSLGRDGGGESSSDKRTFDDIDDFNGWTESPPKDPMMNSLADFDDYTTSVTVRYLDETTLAPTTTKRTDYKSVSACSWRPKRKSVCLDTIITNR